MTPTPPTVRTPIGQNALWFLGLLVVAFFIWMTATAQSDPIEQWRLAERIPIRTTPDAGLTITNAATLTDYANVQLRGQRSVRELLAADDITVTAALAGLPAGTHTVPLIAQVAPDRRVTVAGISPSQVTITLELLASQLVPVTVQVATPPALIFSAGQPQYDTRQVMVSGPASRVALVTAAHVDLDLSDQRELYDADARLLPVDAGGSEVDGVTLEPATVRVNVTVETNSEVREVRVQPNPTGQLPEGYVLTSFDYEPRLVYIGGPVAALESLPGTLLTTPIDLSGQTGSFEQEVTLDLPDPDLVVITGGTITVRVGVDAQIVTRQFDGVPIEIIGERAGLAYTLDPVVVSVLVTAPEPVLRDVTAESVRVLVDVAALPAGSDAPVAPLASIGADAEAGNIAVLPALVNVRVTADIAPTP